MELIVERTVSEGEKLYKMSLTVILNLIRKKSNYSSCTIKMENR